MGRRRKKRSTGATNHEVILNVMPFIDLFSVLTTFLLMVSVFIAIGFHEVRVPFLSSKAPPPDKVNARNLEVKVDMKKINPNDQLELIMSTSWDKGAAELVTKNFPATEEGLTDLHTALVEAKTKHPATDEVELYTDPEVDFDQITLVLDAIKLLRKGESVPQDPGDGTSTEKKKDEMKFLYKKVKMSSVML